jgi:manganese/zinc/iron transport system ATP- binding protein
MQEMTAQGKTVIVNHHDLQSAAEFFDWSFF